MTSKSLLTLGGAVIAIACALGTGPAAAQQKPSQITMISGSPGGSWYPISAGIAKALTDRNINTRLEQGGGNSNILNISAGKAECAFGLTQANYLAQVGKGVFKQPVTNVMGLTVIYTQVMHTPVTVESGVKTYADLKGKRMASQSLATGTRQIFVDILTAYGLNGEDDLEIVTRGSPSVGAKAVKDRQAIGFVTITAPPTSSISETAQAMPIRLLPLSDEALKKLEAINPAYYPGVIPAGSYKGIDEDVKTVADDTVLITHPNVADDTAYWIVRAFADGLDDIRQVHPALKSLTKKKMSEVKVLQLHPGAQKYYKEAGVL